MKEIAASLTLDSNQASGSVKSFKQQLKEAQISVLELSEKYGATSKQATEAAKKAAELKDAIGDSKTLVDAFNPDRKFAAFGAAVSGVTGGFAALQGAMGLLGVESEDVQKSLLKVQSALALSQGVDAFTDSIASIQTLGKQLLNTLGKGGVIAVAIAGVTALGLALAGAFDGADKLTEIQKISNDVNEEAAKIYASERMELEKMISPLKSNTATRKEQEAAIKQLQKTYPNYFKNLDIEKGKVVGLTEGYDKLVQAIRLKARATAAANLLAKQEEDVLKLGFDLGITNEKDAVALIKRIEAGEGIVNTAISNKVSEYLEKKNFLENQIKNSEDAIKNLGGDPKGGQGGTGTSSPQVDNAKKANELLAKLRLENIEDAKKKQEILIQQEYEAGKKEIESLKRPKLETQTLLFELETNKNIKLNAIAKEASDERLKLEQQHQSEMEAISDQVMAKNDAIIDKDLNKFMQQQALSEQIAESEKTEYQLKLERLDEWYQNSIKIAGDNEELLKQIKDKYEKDKTKIEEDQSSARINISKKELDVKLKLAELIATNLSLLADLAGKDTVVQKALGIASATISTYVGAAKALKDDYTAYGPAAPFVRFATVTATILTGLKQVSAIAKVQIPGKGSGGGGSVPSISTSNIQAPLDAGRAQQQSTRIDQALASIGDATIRAYVVESDIQSNSTRIKRLSRAARIG